MAEDDGWNAAEVQDERRSRAREFAKLRTNTKLPKPRWQIFLESTGGAALITVVIGGVVAGGVGTWLTNRYQRAMREREVALRAYNDYLSQGRAIVIDGLGAIGTLLSASSDLLDLTSPDWQFEPDDERSRSAFREQRSLIIVSYNSAVAAWRKDRDRYDLMISYYHDGDPPITHAWGALQTGTDEYVRCTQRVFLKYVTPLTIEQPTMPQCVGERTKVNEKLVDFILARRAAAKKQASDTSELFK